MFPEQHVKEMENFEGRKGLYRKFFAVSIFLASVFIAGPVIHELSHMAVLESINCSYILDWGLNINGVHGSVQPNCVPDRYQLAAFYSVGYLSTIISGGYLSFLTLRERDISSFKMLFYTALGTGLLVSTAISLGITGDLTNLSELLGIGAFETQLFTSGIFIAISVTVVRTLQVAWDLSEREETH